MRKKLLAVLLVMVFAVSLGGCTLSGRQRERPQPDASSAQSEVQGGMSAASETEQPNGPLADLEYDAYTEIYNAYIDVYNFMIGRMNDSLNRYFDYVGYQEEFIAPENIYGCYSISDYEIEAIKTLHEMIGARAEKDELDQSFEKLYPSLISLIDCLNEIYQYTDLKLYMDDDYAKGKEYHAQLWAVVNQYMTDEEPFEAALDRVAAERQLASLQVYEDSGQEMMYTVNLLLISAQTIQAELYDQEVYDENLLDLDMEVVQPLYDEFLGYVTKVLELAKDEEKLEEEGFPYDGIYWDRFLDSMTDTKVSLTDVLQRVKEQRPIEEHEIMMPIAGQATLLSFDEGISDMIDAYNYMIN